MVLDIPHLLVTGPCTVPQSPGGTLRIQHPMHLDVVLDADVRHILGRDQDVLLLRR